MATYRAAWRTAKKLYPLALAAWRRWDQLSDAEKERYKRQAKRYAEQSATYARRAVSDVGRRIGGDKRR